LFQFFQSPATKKDYDRSSTHASFMWNFLKHMQTIETPNVRWKYAETGRN